MIGQACEFDYRGTQACKALREEGYEVVLVNSDPATIMTDRAMADRTYIEPLAWEIVAKVIEVERPDAMLPTLGGQTALNLAIELDKHGVLAKYGVEMIGVRARCHPKRPKIAKSSKRRWKRSALGYCRGQTVHTIGRSTRRGPSRRVALRAPAQLYDGGQRLGGGLQPVGV